MGGSHGETCVFLFGGTRRAFAVLAGIWVERAQFCGFTGVLVSEGRVRYLFTNCRICQLSYQRVQASAACGIEMTRQPGDSRAVRHAKFEVMLSISPVVQFSCSEV